VERVKAAIRQLLPDPLGPASRFDVAVDLSERSALDVAAAAIPRAGVWLDGGDLGGHQIPLRAMAEITASDDRVEVRVGDDSIGIDLRPLAALEALRAVLAESSPGCPRLFGFLGYDLGRTIEDMPEPPPRDIPLPDMWFVVCDVWLEAARTPGEPTWTLRSDTAWCTAATARAALDQLLRGPAAVPGGSTAAVREISSIPDEAGYQAAVAQTVRRIHAGDLFEANVCRRLQADWDGSAWELYLRLRDKSPAVYGAFLSVSDVSVLSVSPELFLRVRGREVETRPIKGTRPRGRTPVEDNLLLEQLISSDKEGAELAMIVDLARNDLGRVCVPGTVDVKAHRDCLRLASVHHTYSWIVGRLMAGLDLDRLLRATFPPGSITGAPKIQAMRVAYAEEPRRRGVAMGSIGWIDPDGSLELSVAIRTATVAAGRATYHAGGGIVAESDPRAEFDETIAKARPFVEALAGE
jgi:para-aminobenzoate synthetase component 1